jgi:transposase
MPQSSPLDSGMDVHQESIAVAYVAQDHGAEVTSLGPIGTRQADLDHRIRTLPSTAHHLVFVSDAGPCGYWLSRDLPKTGEAGWVVAPALMPHKAGDRVNTDRRDAGPLARLMRAGALTPVEVPEVEDEAIRDRSRAREDAIGALQAAKLRRKAVWRRHDIRSTGRATWGPAHRRWRSEVVGPTPAPQLVFQEEVRTVPAHTERLQRLDHALEGQVQAWRLAPVVDALHALRGVQFPVAVTIVAACGDLTRVDTPRPLMSYLDLPPAESSRGERRRQGSITKAGHSHARRVRIEGAWAYRSPANVSRHRQWRLERVPKTLQDSSWKAPVRRCQRDRQLSARGPHAPQVVVAMARELSACMWAIAQHRPVKPQSHLRMVA